MLERGSDEKRQGLASPLEASQNLRALFSGRGRAALAGRRRRQRQQWRRRRKERKRSSEEERRRGRARRRGEVERGEVEVRPDEPCSRVERPQPLASSGTRALCGAGPRFWWRHAAGSWPALGEEVGRLPQGEAEEERSLPVLTTSKEVEVVRKRRRALFFSRSLASSRPCKSNHPPQVTPFSPSLPVPSAHSSNSTQSRPSGANKSTNARSERAQKKRNRTPKMRPLLALSSALHSNFLSSPASPPRS